MDANSREPYQSRPADLPDYTNPPIDEVVIGVTFQPLGPQFGSLLSRFRELVKDRFTRTEYQPRLPPPNQTLTISNSPLPGLPLMPQPTNLGQDPFGRVWLVSEDNSNVIQLQDDRFITNWRHAVIPYPHFNSVAGLFWDSFDQFRSESKELGIEPFIQQVELSYLNWIPFDEEKLYDALKSTEASRVSIGDLKIDMNVQMSQTQYDVFVTGLPDARLVLTSNVGIIRISRTQSAMQRGTLLNLSFHSPVAPGATDNDIGSILAQAREIIVRTFDSLTTETGHQVWGRFS